MLEGGKTLFRRAGYGIPLRHLLVIAVLALAFTSAVIMRSYPAKYGFYLNEFDPYFDYRATKYIVDHGLSCTGNGMILCHGILKDVILRRLHSQDCT